MAPKRRLDGTPVAAPEARGWFLSAIFLAVRAFLASPSAAVLALPRYDAFAVPLGDLPESAMVAFEARGASNRK